MAPAQAWVLGGGGGLAAPPKPGQAGAASHCLFDLDFVPVSVDS